MSQMLRDALPLVLLFRRSANPYPDCAIPARAVGDTAEHVIDTRGDHRVHRLIDVEGVDDLCSRARCVDQGDRRNRTAGNRHHQAIRLGNLVVAAGQVDLFTLGADDGRLPGATRADVEHRRPGLGRQPELEVVGLGEDLPYPLARSSQCAGNGELAHRGLPQAGCRSLDSTVFSARIGSQSCRPVIGICPVAAVMLRTQPARTARTPSPGSKLLGVADRSPPRRAVSLLGGIP